MRKRITIEVDEEHTPERAMEAVLKLICEGYTSGIDPTFDVVEVSEE